MRFLALLPLILATPALADPTMECPGSSQIEIGACVTETLSRVDAAIETAYGFARTSAEALDAETGRASALPALEAAQTAWDAWRNAQCDFAGAQFAGGSGTGIAITACKIELGRERVNALLDAVN